jgi:hypothetical protein
VKNGYGNKKGLGSEWPGGAIGKKYIYKKILG